MHKTAGESSALSPLFVVSPKRAWKTRFPWKPTCSLACATLLSVFSWPAQSLPGAFGRNGMCGVEEKRWRVESWSLQVSPHCSLFLLCW